MRAKTYYTPLTVETARALGELAENHAEPEVCSHLRVYSEDRALLAWHDVVNDPVYLDGTVDEERVFAFCHKLGTTFERGVPPL